MEEFMEFAPDAAQVPAHIAAIANDDGDVQQHPDPPMTLCHPHQPMGSRLRVLSKIRAGPAAFAAARHMPILRPRPLRHHQAGGPERMARSREKNEPSHKSCSAGRAGAAKGQTPPPRPQAFP